jgi:dihydroorotate dehydrogenase (fumarate)
MVRSNPEFMNPDLSVDYLGMKLRTPFVPSASPRSERVDNVERMADAGASAVVFHSLYGEQCESETNDGRLFRISPELYCEHIREAKRRVAIPLIASLNITHPGHWLDAARQIEDAGADAIEVSIPRFPEVSCRSSEEIEHETVDWIYRLHQTVHLPIGVKLTPFYTNLFHLASQLQEVGAKGLTLFNRFVQPDLSVPNNGEFVSVPLSTVMDIRLPMHWIAVLAPRFQLSLAASGGVQRAEDAAHLLQVGADVTMVCSVLLRRGITYLAQLEQGLCAWMNERGHKSISEFQGTLGYSPWREPAEEERRTYIHTLIKSEYRLGAG